MKHEGESRLFRQHRARKDIREDTRYYPASLRVERKKFARARARAMIDNKRRARSKVGA